MRVLALDSAMTGCSACVYDTQEGVLAEQYIDISRGQAEHLIPLINDVLDKADASYDTLDMVAVTQGPGAFTGLRIGLAAAKSIGMVIGKTVVGVCGFQAVLASYLGGEKEVGAFPFYAVTLETKRKDYYFQMFESGINQKYGDAGAMGIDEIVSITEGKKCLFIGDAVQRFEQESGQIIERYQIDSPKSSIIAELAIDLLEESGASVTCHPVYLRSPEIGTPKNPPRYLK